MVKTTWSQRQTLQFKLQAENRSRLNAGRKALTYRQFRRTISGLIGGNGCIMVPWCGMWLGIEIDGYAHT